MYRKTRKTKTRIVQESSRKVIQEKLLFILKYRKTYNSHSG